MSETIGPNVKRLIIERASQLAVERGRTPSGTAIGGVLARMIETDGQCISQDLRDAHDWVKQALRECRNAVGDDRLGSDEELAGEILKGIDAKRAGVRR